MRHLILTLTLCLSALACKSAASSEPGEYEIKAACLFKFLKYVDWPPTAFKAKKSPLVIGILGDNPFGSTLSNIMRTKPTF